MGSSSKYNFNDMINDLRPISSLSTRSEFVNEWQLIAVFTEAKQMCETFDIPCPMVAYGQSEEGALIWFSEAMSQAERLNKPSIVIMSWSAFSCNADNLARMLRFGLRSITHVLGYMGGGTCIVHLDPSWNEEAVLYFYNPEQKISSTTILSEEQKATNQLNQF